MVTAVGELTHLYLPAMEAAGHGRILNVASLAGLVPASPGHTLYGATKAWLIRFSECLALEVARARRARDRAVPGLHLHRVPRRQRHARDGVEAAEVALAGQRRRWRGWASTRSRPAAPAWSPA